MNAITLPSDLQAWAEAEVAAGNAPSVEALTVAALADDRRRRDEFLKSLEDARAEADEKGWLTTEEVFDGLEAELQAMAE